MNKSLDFLFAALGLALLLVVGLLAPSLVMAAPAEAGTGAPTPVWAPAVRELVLAAARQAAPKARIELELGSLDGRLRLAPCNHVEPYLPPGSPAWGKTRVGLRCKDGTVPWNVYLPVTVQVFGKALVAAQPLATGAVLTAADLREAEVDLAAQRSPALARADAVVGRTLARSLGAGDSLRESDLRVRQWFAAGDTVRIDAVGSGYAVSGEGQALQPGLEGQSVRVRTESGRIVTGLPVADRRVELPL